MRPFLIIPSAVVRNRPCPAPHCTVLPRGLIPDKSSSRLFSRFRDDAAIVIDNKVTNAGERNEYLAVCLSLERDTIRYDSVYLTCSKKLTGSQLSPPHGTNKKLKCETKNKTMIMIGPVQSHCHEGSPVGKRSLRWEGFVEKVGFEPGVKE